MYQAPGGWWIWGEESENPQPRRNAPADLSLQTYLRQTRNLEADFPAQVDVYQARTRLSILYYFAKIGVGESEDFWRIQVEAERGPAAVATGLGVGSDNRLRRP
jgi:hypothetical protein